MFMRMFAHDNASIETWHVQDLERVIEKGYDEEDKQKAMGTTKCFRQTY